MRVRVAPATSPVPLSRWLHAMAPALFGENLMMGLDLSQNRGRGLLRKTCPEPGDPPTLRGRWEGGQGQEDILVRCPEWLPFLGCPEVRLAAQSKWRGHGWPMRK